MVQAVGSKQMAELDRLSVRLGTTTPMLMENAGLAVARIAESMSGKRSVAVLAGKGNNGGDGLCAARHLINWGFKARIFLASPRDELNKGALSQLEALEGMNARIACGRAGFEGCDLIIALDAGRIVEMGAHDELMGKKGYYRHLYTQQETG